MMNHNKYSYAGTLVLVLLIFGIWSIVLLGPVLTQGALGAGANQTLNTTVNITNAAPEVRSIALDSPIDLEAFGNRTVFCNTTVFDWDNDTLTVVGYIYIDGISNPSSTNDSNNKYVNLSCSNDGAQAQEMNYTCTFNMEYYADNSSSWQCNITVTDDDNAEGSNISSNSTVNPLVAIYVPGVLDFGEMQVNDISSDKTANITNAGNRNVTLSVEGWGATQGDGLAMNCSYGSIGAGYMKYNETTGQTYSDMRAISNESVSIDGDRKSVV